MEKKLSELLEERSPEYFNLHWIYNNRRALYNTILDFKNKSDLQGLNEIIGTLSPKWQEKWKPGHNKETVGRLNESKRKWKFEKIISRLEEILSENKSVAVSEIETIDRGLYDGILRNAPRTEKNKVDWKLIKSSIKEELRDGLIDPRETEDDTFETAMEKLNKTLTSIADLPGHITSKYIENVALPQYAFFRRYVLDKEGGIDWNRIRENLDKKLRARFVVPRRLKYVMPENLYEDADEVNQVLVPYKEKLYTFFRLLEKGDSEKRNEICLGLVNLAQKGNVLAKERLLFYMKPLIDEWIDRDAPFFVYKYHLDDLDDTMEKCIFYYHDNKQTNFLWYLRAALLKGARKYGKEEVEEFDDKKYMDQSLF